MEKTAVIKSASDPRAWTNQATGSTIYYRVLTMDNGDKGEIGSKEEHPDKLKVGASLTYTLVDGGEYNGEKKWKIKAVVAGGFQGGGRPQANPNQQLATMTAAYAKDLTLAIVTPMDSSAEIVKKFSEIYEGIYTKVKEKC
jgi:hypothetical protein